MKRLVAWWAGRAGVADRLARGSHVVWHQRAAAFSAWVRAGRRDDLEGWQAAIGPLVRVVILGGLAYGVWAVLRAVPLLMWLVAGWWVSAAWKAGKPAPEPAPEKTSETAHPGVSREAVRDLLLTLMGTDSAVHLATVLAHLQQRPDTAALTASWKISDLRARLEALDITVQPKVKAHGKGATRGVRRVDLAPSPGAAPETSTAPSTAA
ncbi:hypothetical protein TPA0905_11980 [Streptomyces olivaceus]|nr:hypothetical protein TPA0905_11980 [Streptomyces olivaceus]